MAACGAASPADAGGDRRRFRRTRLSVIDLPLPDLPPAFLQRLSHLLGDEFPAFLASYASPPRAGLRLNTLRELSNTPYPLPAWERVPWCSTGYVVTNEAMLARHPCHAAGVYYVQEPSAMAPAEILAPNPGEVVLDLCAAPGGKSTHIAALTQNQGLLVANDTHPRRARALAMNLERCGVTCAVVLNETPERLAARWPGYFDRVLADAPCSGQGMFRKSKPARAEWQPGRIKTDAARQGMILDAAAQLVRPGGVIVYSTCTFEPDENEGAIARFLQRHRDFTIEAIERAPGFTAGRPEWADGNPALINTVRLWPHLSVGEGHFIARLRRGKTEGTERPCCQENLGGLAPASFLEFCQEHLRKPGLRETAGFLQAGHEVYLAPPNAPDLNGLRVVRWGWWIGTLKGKVFAPGHALAMALTPADVRQSLDLAPDDPRLAAYLRGDSLRVPGNPGWVLVTVNGFPLGWGKRTGDIIKNRRPPGLAQIMQE